MEEAAQIAKQFGGWGVLLLIVWRVMLWLRPYIEKLFAAHLSLVDSLKDSQVKHNLAIERIATTQCQQADVLTELEETALSNSRLLAELHKAKGT